MLAEALAAGVTLDLVLVSPRATQPRFPDSGGSLSLIERVHAVAERVLDVSEDILAYAADSQHPNGIVAVARVPGLGLDAGAARGGLLLLLDEVRDPGNLGTIARTAYAAGAEALLLTGSCVDLWNPKVVRASAGALFHLPVLRFEERGEAVDWLRVHGQRAVLATASGKTSCFEAHLRAPVTLVLGSEAHGVNEELAAACGESVYIPMTAGCESLNLAASAAILLYLAVERTPR